MIEEQTESTVTEAVVPTFVGLNAYTEKQADFFFGRDEEIDNLYKLVKNHTITIVFGKSGTGKTSLLNAGVFPRLRKDYCLPFRIRLDFSEKAPDLITQVKAVLKTEIQTWGFKVANYPGEETLWEYFHKEPTWNIITPVLVFDQFEEIFTLASKSLKFQHEQLDVFINELADLAENLIPEKIKSKFVSGEEKIDHQLNEARAKIVFAFREDYLAEIESITARIPSIKYSRFRLLAMMPNQAYEVITRTWGDAIKPKEAEDLVSYLVVEPTVDGLTKAFNIKQDKVQVEPSLLSQICAYIDEKRRNEKQLKISADFLSRYPKALILRTLYNEVIDEGKATIKLEKKNGLQIFIEDHLITDDGFRTRYHINDIDNDLRPGMDVLKKKYFTRENDETVELTHDVIVTLVRNDREARRKQEALIIAKANAQKKQKIILIRLVLLCIGFWVFTAGLSWWNKLTLDEKKVKLEGDTLQLNNLKNYLTLSNTHLDKKNNQLEDEGKKLELKKVSLVNEESILRKKVAEKNRELEELGIAKISPPNLPINPINPINPLTPTFTSDRTNEQIKSLTKQIKEYELTLFRFKDSLRLIKKQYDANIQKITNEKNKYNNDIANSLINKVGQLTNERDSLLRFINSKRWFDLPKDPNNRQKGKIFGWGYDYPPKN